MNGQQNLSIKGAGGNSFTEADGLFLKSLHHVDQLLPVLSNFVIFRFPHIFNLL